MSRQRKGVLLIAADHLEKHRQRYPRFKPLNVQLLFAIRALAQRINDDITERFAEIGLTARQYNYLSVINVEKGISTNEIGTLIHTANPTVTQMLNALERDGLIVRKQHPHDRRRFVVKLTPKGRALYEKAFRLHHDHLEDRMSAALSVAEREQLLGSLVRLGESFAPADEG